jgi:predicted ATPase/DNA-binding SARP family transcriptional activator
VQIGMLGPLEVRTGSGDLLEVGGARLRALLILLALEPGRVVTTSRLVDALWDEDQVPAGASNALQALVSRLRRALPGITVALRPSGYRLELPPDAVDVHRFERLAAAGRAELPHDPAAALATLRDALALWRGPALADVAEERFARATVARLDELRLAALQDRIEAELRLGSPSPSLVAELEALVVAYPLREPLVGLLMRVLYALGQRGAALVAYERARARLADQLGTDPSGELVALHTALLRDALDTPPRPPAQRAAAERPAGRPVAGSSAAERSAARPGAESPAVESAAVESAAAQSRVAQSRVAQSLAAGGAAAESPAASPAPAAAPRSTNLRAELTSFVGRDGELSEVGRLLGASRLTTLTGPGGAGKTRLAIEAARAQLGAMPDGVWLVELAPVTDPGEVAQTALATLGLRETGLLANSRLRAPVPEESAEPLGRLVAALSGKRVLLVLDNCEHLVEAAAAVADRILGACPTVRIVATSREPLGITGERLWPVEPLALPPDDAEVATAARCAAVRLLADRARAVRPGFEVSDANLAAVVRICRALDGMPLAIELAAARLRAMAPDEVAARLDDRFRLLTGGSRTALPRHQTLRAVVDWSWELLSEPERALCRRLAGFAGGATLEAAEQVCSGGPVARADVLDLLTALVDKSLLVVRQDADGGTRYRMLETIRAYGQERLAEADEREPVRAAHAAYFRGLAERAEEHLLAREQLRWLSRLAADHDNLHAALRAAVVAGDTSTAVGLLGRLGWYWWLRGHKIEGFELAETVFAMPGTGPDGPPDEALAVAYATSALLAIDGAHDSARAVTWFDAAAALTPGPVPEHPVLRMVHPMHALFRMVQAEQASASMDVLDASVEDPHPWVAATARIMRGHLELNFGRQHAQAEADFHAALDLYRSVGERWGTGFALSSLAMLLSWRGEYATAVAYIEEAVASVTELGVAEDQAQFQVRLAHLWWLLGEPDRAKAALAEAQRNAYRVGLSEAWYFVALASAELARHEGDMALARKWLAEAAEVTTNRLASAPQARAMVACSQGYLAAEAGDLDAACAHHAAALEAALKSVDSPIIAQVLVGVADLAVRDGDAPRAAALLGAGEAIRGARDLSQVDEVRVTEAARAVLGDGGFAEAYRSGLGTTMRTVPELAAPVLDRSAGLRPEAPAGLRPGGGTPVPPAARTPR